MSTLAAWLFGLVLCAGGGFALALGSLDFSLKVTLACAMVFLVDKLGGRWFGFFSLLVLFAGLWQDTGQWALVLPILLGAGLAALILRHAEPGWLGVPLTVVAFALPVLLLGLLKGRIDPTFGLPRRYLELHLLAGAASVVGSSVLEQLISRFNQTRVAEKP